MIPPTDPSGTPISGHLDGRSRDYLLARAKRVVDGVAVIDDPAVLEVQKKVVYIINLTFKFQIILPYMLTFFGN